MYYDMLTVLDLRVRVFCFFLSFVYTGKHILMLKYRIDVKSFQASCSLSNYGLKENTVLFVKWEKYFRTKEKSLKTTKSITAATKQCISYLFLSQTKYWGNEQLYVLRPFCVYNVHSRSWLFTCPFYPVWTTSVLMCERVFWWAHQRNNKATSFTAKNWTIPCDMRLSTERNNYLYLRMRFHAHTYSHSRTSINTETYIHTYIHTYTQIQMSWYCRSYLLSFHSGQSRIQNQRPSARRLQYLCWWIIFTKFPPIILQSRMALLYIRVILNR